MFREFVIKQLTNTAAHYFHTVGFSVYKSGQATSFTNGGVDLGEKLPWASIADNLAKLKSCNLNATRSDLIHYGRGRATPKSIIFEGDDSPNLKLILNFKRCNPGHPDPMPEQYLKTLLHKNPDLGRFDLLFGGK